MKRSLTLFLLFLGAILMMPGSIAAQRDYFTAEEVELIREAQQIDERIDMLVAIMDRRFSVLKLDVGASPRKVKKGEEWGEPPTGSRLALLYDVKRVMQKAIDDIDSIAERPSSMVVDTTDKKPKSFDELFPKAVRSLAAAARRYQPALKRELDKPNDMSEKGTILDTLEMCDQVIAAVEKLKAEPGKPKN